MIVPPFDGTRRVSPQWRARTDEIARLRAERDALRAVLAPLLDEPWTVHGTCHWRCRCCGCVFDPVHVDGGHKADCIVLRRDALLGRGA